MKGELRLDRWRTMVLIDVHCVLAVTKVLAHAGSRVSVALVGDHRIHHLGLDFPGLNGVICDELCPCGTVRLRGRGTISDGDQGSG
ncbi:hypothetical protein FB451DRAFT_1293994 [Mycena latifolia]|nr:hypothetical protein FB451DRAFT_1293994 [Mycena latifolia]